MSISVISEKIQGNLYGPYIQQEYSLPQTPTSNFGGIAKSEDLKRLVEETLIDKFDVSYFLRFADHKYYLPTKKEVKLILEKSRNHEKVWIRERFDCDDFAYVLKGDFSLHAYHTDEKDYGLCVGMIWAYFNWTKEEEYHAVNWFIGDDSTLYFIEPQSSEIYGASECKKDVSLFLC